MPTTLFAYDHFTSGVRAESATSDSDYIIDTDVLFGSSDSTAMVLTGSDHDVFVRGTLFGDTLALRLGDSSGFDGNNLVSIAQGGAIQGRNGIEALGYTSISNRGEIAVHNSGILMVMANLAASDIVNEGAIKAGYIAISASLYDTATLSVTNRGIISGQYGIVAGGAATTKASLLNQGIIEGVDYSYLGGDTVDTIVNRGLMRGEVWLGWGSDRFDNRGGEVMGPVSGGADDDVFLPGLGDDDFDGGGGVDTLDFRGSAGLRVSLADGSGTGRAEGDVYLNFERVLGSRSGADTLIGNAAGNTLLGFGGADALAGDAGDDQLAGGAGIDRLRGGLGNDAFVFGSVAQGGDLVSDFRGVTGNDDRFELSAEGFGNVLAQGGIATGLFVTRQSDNLAQDADDHLVFRKDNATLWWDADGKGGAAAVLLADLQAGAVVTAADILMV